MPWRCPACHVHIAHSDVEERPRVGVTYRCHICRLELAFDPDSDKMTVAALRDMPDGRERATS